MIHLRPVVFGALLLLLVGAPANRASAQSEDPGELARREARADYEGYFREAHDRLRKNPPWLQGGKEVRDGGVKRALKARGKDRTGMAEYASGTLALALASNDGKLLDLGRRLYDALLENLAGRGSGELVAGEDLSDPALASALGACAYLLHQSGALDGGRLTKTREFARRLQEASFPEKPRRKDGGFDGDSDNHHRMKRLEAAAYLSAVFRGNRELARIHEHNAAALDWLTARGDMTVNANHLAAMSVCSMINIFRANDSLHALRNPAHRNLFVRFRDLVMPSGYLPRWGADRWGPDLLWVYLLEAAERVLPDGTFQSAAQKAFDTYRRHHRKFSSGNWDGVRIDASDMHMAGGLLSLQVVEMLPLQSTPDTLSGVKSTQLFGEFHEHRKLILRTGFSSLGAAVTMDLGGRGAHSHPDQRPAVNYFEAGGVPLFRGSGKHLFRGSSSNLVWLSGPRQPFPPLRYEIEKATREKRLARYGKENNYPWLHWNHGPFTENLEFGNVRAEWLDGDAGGFVEFSVYYSKDTSLTRRLVLTREGILVVRDDLRPGKSVNGFLAGSLWCREKNGISGDNWFEQPPADAYPAVEPEGEPARMSLLIHHGKGNGRTFGAAGMSVLDLPSVVKAVREGRPAPGSVTFSKQRIATGKPVTFLTVLVPFSPSGSAGQIAEGISSNVRDGVARVRVDAHAAGRESVDIEIAADGKWSVRR